MANCLIMNFPQPGDLDIWQSPAPGSAFISQLESRGHSVTHIDASRFDPFPPVTIALGIIYEKIYLNGHSLTGYGDLLSGTPMRLVAACLCACGTIAPNATVTMIACHGAEPVIASQLPGEPLPATLPAAVHLLQALRARGVVGVEVFAYVGVVWLIGLTAQMAMQSYADPPKFGQLVVTRSFVELADISTTQPSVASHFFPFQNTLAIRPRHLNGAKFKFSYGVTGLLEVTPVPARA